MFDFIKELGKIEVLYNNNGLDDKYITLKSYVKSIELGYIVIDFLFYKKSEFYIPEGSLIKVNFKNKSGVHSGDCYVLGKENSKLPGIKISYPTNVEFIQQREYVRVPLKLNIELVVFPETEDGDVNIYEINALDVSGSGFCFISNKPIEKHSRIVGIINLPSMPDEPLEAELTHIYSRPFIAGTKEAYKNAFSFNKINEALREKILKEIFLYELEMRKKGV